MNDFLKINILMSLICSPNFQFTFSLFDKVTYVTGSYRLTPQRTVCKHFLKDSAFNSLQERICLQNSLGGEQTHSQLSVYTGSYIVLIDSFSFFVINALCVRLRYVLGVEFINFREPTLFCNILQNDSFCDISYTLVM